VAVSNISVFVEAATHEQVDAFLFTNSTYSYLVFYDMREKQIVQRKKELWSSQV
jgi:hypothetical protein